MKLDQRHVLAGLGIAAAAGIAYVATRSAGPIRLPQFTELVKGPQAQQTVTLEQLGEANVLTPHRYPSKVAPGVADAIANGFAPLYQLPDPQTAALPAEQN